MKDVFKSCPCESCEMNVVSNIFQETLKKKVFLFRKKTTRQASWPGWALAKAEAPAHLSALDASDAKSCKPRSKAKPKRIGKPN